MSALMLGLLCEIGSHDKCPGGEHQEGVIGGWDCSCECHRLRVQPTGPSYFDIVGVTMRRDVGGTVHVEGYNLRPMIRDCRWEETEPRPPVAFCIHDDNGRCPSDDGVPYGQMGSLIRWVRDPNTSWDGAPVGGDFPRPDSLWEWRHERRR